MTIYEDETGKFIGGEFFYLASEQYGGVVALSNNGKPDASTVRYAGRSAFSTVPYIDPEKILWSKGILGADGKIDLKTDDSVALGFQEDFQFIIDVLMRLLDIGPDVTPTDPRGTHASHCCVLHGCKYGDGKRGCVVEAGLVKQDYLCEYCTYDSLEDKRERLVELQKEIDFIESFQK